MPEENDQQNKPSHAEESFNSMLVGVAAIVLVLGVALGFFLKPSSFRPSYISEMHILADIVENYTEGQLAVACLNNGYSWDRYRRTCSYEKVTQDK